MPLDPDELEAWALALDEKRPRFGRSMDPGVLCDLTDLEDTEGMSELGIARAMFRQRISETPGCIILDGDNCKQPLTITRTWAPEDPKLEEHFALLRREKITPDGWDLTDPLSEMACETQLGTGFTYVPDPRPPEDWCETRRIFARFVRARIEATADSRKPLDTEQAVVKAHYDHPIVEAWREMKPTFKYESRPEWYSGSVLDTAAAWADNTSRKGGRGLLWVQHEAFGVALSQLTKLPFYGAQGRAMSGERIEEADPPARGDPLDGRKPSRAQPTEVAQELPRGLLAVCEVSRAAARAHASLRARACRRGGDPADVWRFCLQLRDASQGGALRFGEPRAEAKSVARNAYTPCIYARKRISLDLESG